MKNGMRTSGLWLGLLSAIAWSGLSMAHPVADDTENHPEKIVLAAAGTGEQDAAADSVRELVGPMETSGIASIDPLGIIELGGEFPAMTGRQLRARVFTIEPGGIVGLHTHQQRPGYAYILSGTIIEHRNDRTDAVTHAPGSAAMEKSGVSHWWENTSDQQVKALVVDIFTPEAK